MSLSKLVGIIVVIAVAVGGVLWYQGSLKVSGGGVSLDTSSSDQGDKDYYGKGDAHFLTFKYADAISAYKKGLAEDPGHRDAPLAMYRVAVALEKNGQLPESLAAYRDYTARWPNDKRVNEAKERIEYLTSTGVK